jgi:hypothetical protein
MCAFASRPTSLLTQESLRDIFLVMCEKTWIIIWSAVLFVFMLAQLSSCAVSLPITCFFASLMLLGHCHRRCLALNQGFSAVRLTQRRGSAQRFGISVRKVSKTLSTISEQWLVTVECLRMISEFRYYRTSVANQGGAGGYSIAGG